MTAVPYAPQFLSASSVHSQQHTHSHGRTQSKLLHTPCFRCELNLQSLMNRQIDTKRFRRWTSIAGPDNSASKGQSRNAALRRRDWSYLLDRYLRLHCIDRTNRSFSGTDASDFIEFLKNNANLQPDIIPDGVSKQEKKKNYREHRAHIYRCAKTWLAKQYGIGFNGSTKKWSL